MSVHGHSHAVADEQFAYWTINNRGKTEEEHNQETELRKLLVPEKPYKETIIVRKSQLTMNCDSRILSSHWLVIASIYFAVQS